MKYVTGLVVGKFCPLHAGHIALIEFARTQCERLIVLSYTSNDFPGCEPEKRQAWLDEIFTAYPSMVIKVLPSDVVPDDNASEDTHRFFCADYLLNNLETTVDAVFTSEDYGDGFANYLSQYFSFHLKIVKKVEHVIFDKIRAKMPVSGTQMREMLANGKVSYYLPWNVRADFVPKILLLGGESTGKSTLAKALAQELNCIEVPEFGRTLYDERGGDLRFEDMVKIAEVQVAMERRATIGQDLIVCDTSPLTTLFYSEVMFGRVASRLQELSETVYNHVYVCAPDIDFEQDGTRRDASFRMQGHEWYLKTLTERNIPFKIVSGSVEERGAFIKADINR